MFDRKKYVIDKIYERIGSKFSPEYLDDCKNVIEHLPNLDVANSPAESFELSVIGWATLCKIFETLIADKREINVQNIKELYFDFAKNKFDVSRKTDLIDESLFVEEDAEEKLSRLLEITDELDLTESFDAEDLTEEGLREQQFIAADATSLDGDDIDLNIEQTRAIVLQPGQEIFSPFSESHLIYQINNDTFLDIDEGREFKVKIKDNS